MTGVSASRRLAARSIIGIIGVLMIWSAARDPRRHDDARRLRDVHLLHRPDGGAGRQIASIGTQITEAFAGLDRIREIHAEHATEDEEDAARRRSPIAATSRSTTSGSSTTPACRC
jgi:ABC-type nickel/cobalt efflux system permease component RcnA